MYKQNSFITRYCLAGAVVLALLGPLAQNGRGDFTLTDNQQLTVNLSHNEGTLYDTSRVSIVTGGNVTDLYAYNSSTANISGGGAYFLYAHDSSTVNISGGGVTFLCTYDSSTANISGGSVYVLYAIDSTSAVNISGGGFYALYDYGSAMDISGGSSTYLFACSNVNISGGSLGNLYAWGSSSSVVTLHGQNFLATGGLVLDGERVLGTGILSGEWMDGTPWAMNIYGNDPTTTVLAISEPAVAPAPGAALLGVIGLACSGWRLRRRTA